MTNLQLLDPESGDGKGASVAAKRIHTVLLQRLNEVGHSEVAASLGVHDSTVSRFKTESLERVSQFLAALGMKVVPAESKRYDDATVAALLALAKQRMGQIQSIGQLACEDDD